MFSLKKLVLVAACVALALGPSAVAAESQGLHLRIRISEDSVGVKGAHSLAKAPAAEDSSKDGDDDAKGSGKDDDEGSGDNDDENEGHGEYGNDGEDKDAGSQVDDQPAFCKGEGEYTMSIEYVAGDFCVKGPACTADNADGVCPGPQKGLPLGAECSKVSTGVYGCKPIMDAPPASDGSDASSSGDDDAEGTEEGSADFCAGEDESEMSVEGARGMYCIKGQACVSDIADGVCPGVQKGLPFGSSCGMVSTGVYGCKVNTKAVEKKKEEDAKKKKKTSHHKVSAKKTAKKISSHAKPAQHSKKVEHAKKPSTVHHKKTVEHAKKPAAVHHKKTVEYAKKPAAVHHKKTTAAHQKKKYEAHGTKKKATVHVRKSHKSHDKKN